MCSKLTVKIQQRHQRRSGVFIINFEHILHLFRASIVDFEQVNVSWDGTHHSLVMNVSSHMALRKQMSSYSNISLLSTNKVSYSRCC